MSALIACPGQRCGVLHHQAGSGAAVSCLHKGVTSKSPAPTAVSSAAVTLTEQLFIEASVIKRSTAGVLWALELESATSEDPVPIEYLGKPHQPTEAEVLTYLQVHRPQLITDLGLKRQSFTATELAQHCLDLETKIITELAISHRVDSEELFAAVSAAEDAAIPKTLQDVLDRRHQQNLDALANVAEPQTGESPWLHYGLRGPQELRSGASLQDEAARALDALDSQESHAWARELSQSEHTAINQYCGSLYWGINEALRSGHEMDRFDKDLVQSMDSALAKAESGVPRVLYRGFAAPDGADAAIWAEQTFPIDGEVTFASYLSTTRDVSTATRFARNSENGIVLEILTGQGTSVSAISRHGDGERERLLPRNLSMKVVGVHREVPFSSYGSVPEGWTVVQLVEASALEEQSS